MNKLKKKFTILVMLILPILVVSISPIVKADTPQNWIRFDEEGMFHRSPGGDVLKLLNFGGDLYAYDSEQGLYKLRSEPCLEWKKEFIPSLVGLTDQYMQGIIPMGDILYLADNTQLWMIKKGEEFNSNNWQAVTSSGLPSNSKIIPMTIFNNQLYAAVFQADSFMFDIYRSPDLGKVQMSWNKVVSNGFGNPLNHELGFMTVYKNKLIAVTSNTRTDPKASFGHQDYFGPGIQVWESPTGDDGSWYQVNKDGFGTELTEFDSDLNKDVTFRTNQDFGAGAVYNGYLYIGTRAHFYGAQVWRYDGTGLNGWEEVKKLNSPSRVMSMEIYQNYLYLAEGYPTGNLDKYDGTNWEIVVSSNPFADTNKAFSSLAIVGEKIYAATIPNPYLTNPYEYMQVWGYPFLFKPATCSALTGATISISPKSDTNELGSFNIHTVIAKVEANGAGVPGVNINFKIISGPNTNPANVGSGPTNSTGQAPFNYSAKQGPTGLGTDVIEACFINEKEEKVCTQATKKWVDTTPPVVKCLETSVDKKTGTYELTAKDAVDPNPKIFVIDTGSGTEFGPFTSGTIIQYTENPGKPKSKKNEKDVEIKGNGKPAVRAVDASGNEAKASCTIPH